MNLRSPYRFPYCLRDYFDPRHYYAYVKQYVQRARRGYADVDLWSFDHYLAEMLIKVLPHYQNKNHPYVMFLLDGDFKKLIDNRLATEEEREEAQAAMDRWDATIDEILEGMRKLVEPDVDVAEGWQERYRVREENIERAFQLFIENVRAMWD